MNWALHPLQDIAQVFGSGTPSCTTQEYWRGDIPWVTPTDLPMPGKGIADVFDTEERIRRTMPSGMGSDAKELVWPRRS